MSDLPPPPGSQGPTPPGPGQPGPWQQPPQQPPYPPPAPGSQPPPPPGQYQPGGYPAPAQGRQFAGWWTRFVAYLIDGVIVGIPLVIIYILLVTIFGAAGDAARGIGAVLGWIIIVVGQVAYLVYGWSNRQGQTFGDSAMGIRVVRTDGSAITAGTAIIRWLGYVVNSIICGLPIGFIWAAFDQQKQGWHDKIAGTYVVKA